MTRTYWRKAHPVKLPERPAAFIAVHSELLDAYQIDRLRERIEAELERDLERGEH